MEKCLPLYAVCFTVGVALATDLCRGKIPNMLTISSLACGLLVHGLWGDGLIWSILGAVLGFAIFLFPFMLGGMGGGDVKLFAALGAWLGWQDVLLTALLTAVAGGGLALILLIYNNGRWDGLSQIALAWRVRDVRCLRTTRRFPYTIPTSMGVLAVLWRSWI